MPRKRVTPHDARWPETNAAQDVEALRRQLNALPVFLRSEGKLVEGLYVGALGTVTAQHGLRRAPRYAWIVAQDTPTAVCMTASDAESCTFTEGGGSACTFSAWVVT